MGATLLIVLGIIPRRSSTAAAMHLLPAPPVVHNLERSLDKGDMDMQRYGPPDAPAATGPAGGATFLRLPLIAEPGGVDVAVVGLPLDGAAAPGVGAGLGPRAVRESSLDLRAAYNPSQRVAPFKEISVVDAGDAPVDAGDAPVEAGAPLPSLEAVQAALAPWFEAGVTPLGLGGDGIVLLAELRAAAAVQGPLALLSFDAHVDGGAAGLGESPSRSTVVRAAAEGLIDPRRSTVMGVRGGRLRAPTHRSPQEARIRPPSSRASAAMIASR